MTVNCAECGLGFLAEVFEDDVADGCGDDRDGEVLDGEDVGEGDGESFAGAIGAVEFAHEEVGVEEEDDERDFDDRMADFGGEARFLGVFRHGDEGRIELGPVLAGRLPFFAGTGVGTTLILCHAARVFGRNRRRFADRYGCAARIVAGEQWELFRRLREICKMAYVIAEPCIGTKDAACVDACPVDCIHPKKDEAGFAETDQLFIDPVECIDCGACVPVCPVSAIYAADDLPEKWADYQAKNAAHFGR